MKPHTQTPTPTPTSQRSSAAGRREGGIVLAIVLVLIFALITAVYAFQRRALIDTTIAQNRLAAAEADALARGGIRIAEAVVYLARLKEAAAEGETAGGTGDAGGPASGLGPALLPGGDLWERIGDFPLEFAHERSLRITIEDEGVRLNLNALVPPSPADEGGEEDDLGAAPEDDAGESLDDAEQYLIAVLDYIIEGMPGTREEKRYDTTAIARNLIDWMDADSTARDGRDEDAYYQDLDPKYRASNGPFLSFEEIGLVEGIDGQLLAALRDSLTVHPIGGQAGINLNRAEPWVLSLVYAGVDGDRRLVGEKTVRAIWHLRSEGKILCGDGGGDPKRCVPVNEVANGALAEGSIYPPVEIPAKPTVFRVVAEARAGNLVRRHEAIIDTRSSEGPLLLSWRRLRGIGAR
jgi:hypothetical protein